MTPEARKLLALQAEQIEQQMGCAMARARVLSFSLRNGQPEPAKRSADGLRDIMASTGELLAEITSQMVEG